MNCRFELMDKADRETILPVLFRLLAGNMRGIAPTGNTYEEDFSMWKSAVYPALDRAERQIILIKDADALAGYFQYYISTDTFIMEEIQFEPRYWGSGLFRKLYEYLAVIVPAHIRFVEAYSQKPNQKSQAILKHLGLEIIGENKSGNSYRFRGDCQKLLDRYR